MLAKRNMISLCQLSQLVLFTLATIFGFSTSAFLNATITTCGTSIVPIDSYDRIVGGIEAVPGEFPWMVSLRERNDRFDHTCGATIINENWIVTAAHCISYAYADRYEIWVGLHKQITNNEDSKVRKYKVSKIIVHEKYVEDGYYKNDIALLKTKEPIDIAGSKGYINTICLPKDKQDPTGFATVIGWGHTYSFGVKEDALRKVVVPIVERKECKKAYDEAPIEDRYDIIDTMICAGKEGKDSCQYDSGGPFFQTDKNGVSTLIGVVSFGEGCGRGSFPGVYTKVSMFQDWMNDKMSK